MPQASTRSRLTRGRRTPEAPRPCACPRALTYQCSGDPAAVPYTLTYRCPRCGGEVVERGFRSAESSWPRC